MVYDPCIVGDEIPNHEQASTEADSPSVVVPKFGRQKVAFPCAIPGISLTNYSVGPAGKGWGGACTGGRTTITLSQGSRLTVHSAIAELVTLIMDANLRDGYYYDAYTGAYNCRYISGTTIWSNHAWGLAIDENWDHNPQRRPLTTDKPPWERARWNRYGFAWGGDYSGSTVPDAMHFEFMGTPAQAMAATNLARVELSGQPVPPVDPGQQIRADQYNLNDTGFPCAQTGVWDAQSISACRAFQFAARIVVDGICGDATRAKLRLVPSWHSHGNVTDDDGGYPASTWQEKLAQHGWHITVDNVWGAHSASILGQFQADKGLTVDGHRGPQSWTCLYCTVN